MKPTIRRLALAMLAGSMTPWVLWAEETGPRPSLVRPVMVVRPPQGHDNEGQVVLAPDREALRPQLGAPIPRLGAPRPVVREAASPVAPVAAWEAPLPLPQPPPPAEEPKPSEAKPSEAKPEVKKPAEPKPEAPPQPGSEAPAATPMLPPPTPVFQGLPVYEGELPPGALPSGLPSGEELCHPICPEMGGCGGFHGPHGPIGRVWMRFEYLGWALKADQAPPLVTTANLAEVPPGAIPGALGVPGTAVLFGGGDLNMGFFSGGRVTLGWWWDRCERMGMDGSFFLLQQRNKTFAAASNLAGNPPLFRPFFNTLAFDPATQSFGPSEDVQLIAFPDVLAGAVDVRYSTRMLGADLNFRRNLAFRPHNGRAAWSWDGIAGFRFLRLDESLTISEDLVGLEMSPAPGTRFLVQDRFSAINNFYGPQVGVIGEVRWRRLFINTSFKLALGATAQRVEIEGETYIVPPAGPGQALPGGLLARPSNIGSYNRNVFSIVPELGVQLGLQVTDHMRIFLGYNLLVWTNVQRPGAAVPRAVNGTFLQRSVNGVPAPTLGREATFFVPSSTTFWAQGVTAGLEWKF